MITENPAFDSLLRPESIPAELKAIPRWLLWKLETRDGKPTKTPYQACGTLAKVNDPSTWTDFDTALAAYLKGGFSGIGIVLTDDDDLVGIDLDKCLNPVTGELEPDAAAIVAELPTYCEVSPSGRGLRLFGFGTLPQGGRRKGHVEMYESGRYLTVTGNRFNGHAALAHITPELAAVHARIFAKPDPVDTKPGKAEPPNLDDAELLDKARRARNGAEFDRLWSGDTSGQGGDASAADLALCNLLAFWTGNDPARMDRLFRQSGLFRPAKWDKAHSADGRTYGQMTLDKAIAGNRETYSGRCEREPGCDDDRDEEPAGAPAGGLRFCDADKLRSAEMPEPRFLIKPLIPRDQVTLFGGHGGSGKTMTGYVLAAHIATGTNWAGITVMPGRVLVVSFEDPEELMLWRFRNVAEQYGLDIERMIRNLRLIDATEAQPIMREVNEHGLREVRATADGSRLMEMIAADRYDLALVDNVSDAFDGDENNRRQVRQFVRYLAHAIRAHHGALLLLAHIDKTAARYGAAGNSYSGSTAWHNSVRSRLALANDELKQEKLNVGKRLQSGIKLSWSAIGVPVPDDGTGDQAARDATDREDDAAILACFQAAQEAGATVPAGETGPCTTWHALSCYRELSQDLRKNKERFREGIARLIRAGKVRREEYRNVSRKLKERLVLEPRQFAPVHELEQNCSKHTPLCASSKHRGVGIGAAHIEPERKLEQPAPVETKDDPVARRTAELVALGWAFPNAKARALDEARDPRMVGETAP